MIQNIRLVIVLIVLAFSCDIVKAVTKQDTVVHRAAIKVQAMAVALAAGIGSGVLVVA